MPLKKIMIDPGHGGAHSGGVNKQLGKKEKDIVLAIAEYMKEELKENHPSIGYELTRAGDITLSLQKRCQMANESGADLFLSIHTNARLMKGKYGLEIETYHDKGSVKGKEFATVIHKNLIDDMVCNVPTIDRGVKIGKRWSDTKQKWMPFYVLRHTAMPAALAELGFLSDFEEATILLSSQHQQTMGRILAQSVAEYFGE